MEEIVRPVTEHPLVAMAVCFSAVLLLFYFPLQESRQAGPDPDPHCGRGRRLLLLPASGSRPGETSKGGRAEGQGRGG